LITIIPDGTIFQNDTPVTVTGLTPTAVGQIVRGERAITVKTAYLLAKAFGTSAEFWLNLQHDYELLSFDSSSLKDVPDLTHCV